MPTTEYASHDSPELSTDTQRHLQDHARNAVDAGTVEHGARQVQTYVLQLERVGADGSDSVITRTIFDRDVLEGRIKSILFEQNLTAIFEKVIASLNRTIARVNKRYEINRPLLDRQYFRNERYMARLARAQRPSVKIWLLLQSVEMAFQDGRLPRLNLFDARSLLEQEIRKLLFEKLEEREQDLARKGKQFHTIEEQARLLDNVIELGLDVDESISALMTRFNRTMSWVQTPTSIPELTGFLPNPEEVPRDLLYDDDYYRSDDGVLVPLWSDGQDRTVQELVRQAFGAMGPWPTMRGALTKRKKVRTVHEQLESAASRVDHGEKKRVAAQRLNGFWQSSVMEATRSSDSVLSSVASLYRDG